MTDPKKKPGPEPERVKTDLDWEDAVKRALEKKRPEDGWPKPESDSGAESHSQGEKDQK